MAVNGMRRRGRDLELFLCTTEFSFVRGWIITSYITQNMNDVKNDAKQKMKIDTTVRYMSQVKK